MRSLLLALMMTVLTGCATSAPYEQRIEGLLLKDGAPAVNVKVRFLYEYPEDTCETPGLEATTDQCGKFCCIQHFGTTKNENHAAVVIRPYRLCISTGGKWKIVWKEKTGHAPKSIAFQCSLDNEGGALCKVWNAQLR